MVIDDNVVSYQHLQSSSGLVEKFPADSLETVANEETELANEYTDLLRRVIRNVVSKVIDLVHRCGKSTVCPVDACTQGDVLDRRIGEFAEFCRIRRIFLGFRLKILVCCEQKIQVSRRIQVHVTSLSDENLIQVTEFSLRAIVHHLNISRISMLT